MSQRLPRFVVFYSKSAAKYLTYQSGQELGMQSGKVSSPLSKFEVVPSMVDSSKVHLRSCYNNKYLRQKNSKEILIIAAADKAEEQNQTLWSSTLFQPEFVADGSVRLLHVYSKQYLEWYSYGHGHQDSLILVDSKYPNPNNNVFQPIDWESLVTLPRRLSFKGDNWWYLGLSGTGTLLQFETQDQGHKSVVNEIVYLPDGTFRIKNVSLGAFWKINAQTGFISADDKSTTPTPESLFSAVKANESSIALRSLGNNKLCKRFTILKNVINGLNAMESEITQYARLMLTELVASRSITNIDFHANDGWVYSETTNVVLNPGQDVINHTTKPQTLEVNIPYYDVKTSKYCTGTAQTLKQLGPVFEIHPKETAHVSDSRMIEIIPSSLEPPSYVSGETKSKESWTFKSHQIVLKPMTKVTLKLFANSIACDVPFTYTQHDVLDEATKQVEIRVMDDGVYTGTNYINVTVDASPPEPIFH
uniref:Amaranthin-like lectin n=1 Tax=Linum usitatissimum TaxID=4006 RepID=A0A097PIE5_LINUS|nr:amaranthin-like lectin [Linum usitatissimum]